MNILNMEHISKTYGDKVIFDDISVGIHQGDKIGLIGINGQEKQHFKDSGRNRRAGQWTGDHAERTAHFLSFPASGISKRELQSFLMSLQEKGSRTGIRKQTLI